MFADLSGRDIEHFIKFGIFNKRIHTCKDGKNESPLPISKPLSKKVGFEKHRQRIEHKVVPMDSVNGFSFFSCR